ncbi:hypothetical protein D4764_0192100 [Takifugu flavidus]|uniref:Endonuclease/exonuclease/phosphatase domain-containing protein n=1 Tax=Takifugu flavidus TaxID=433684 RepID=A0A5C6MHJ9_9TELE|nr:hypothetical protein D4764_0192100 [Takifugu flavidus]
MNTFKIGTLNVNGARDARKRALVFDTAKRKRIDVLFLQETDSDCGIEVDWEKEWEGQVLLSHNTTLSGGVGLLFSRGFTPSSLEVKHVVRGRCLMVKACLQNHSLVFINIYAPTNDRNHAEPHPASQHCLRQLAYSHGLVDVWRRMYADSRQYTKQWWDRGKVEIQLLCQQYTLNATQDTRRSIKDLEMEIVELEVIGSSTGDQGCIETLQSKKMALASLLDSQVQGALVRSRIQDLTEMDAPSSFFFGLKKCTEPDNPFTVIEHRAGTRRARPDKEAGSGVLFLSVRE